MKKIKKENVFSENDEEKKNKIKKKTLEELKKEMLSILYEKEDIENIDDILNKVEQDHNLSKEQFLIKLFAEFVISEMNPKAKKYILEKNYLSEEHTNHFLSKLLSEYCIEDSNALTEILISILIKKKILSPIDFI